MSFSVHADTVTVMKADATARRGRLRARPNRGQSGPPCDRFQMDLTATDPQMCTCGRLKNEVCLDAYASMCVCVCVCECPRGGGYPKHTNKNKSPGHVRTPYTQSHNQRTHAHAHTQHVKGSRKAVSGSSVRADTSVKTINGLPNMCGR